MAGLEAKDVLLATALGGASGGGGGASNIVTGTFTTGEAATKAVIDTGYAGDGWLSAFGLYAVGGPRNVEGDNIGQQAWADAKGHRYVGGFVFLRNIENVSPAEKPYGGTFMFYKDTTTSAISMNGGSRNRVKWDDDTEPPTSFEGCIKMRSNTRIEAFIPTGEPSFDYGLAPGVEYRFYAVYSE